MHTLILLLSLITSDISFQIKQAPGFIVNDKFIIKYECKSDAPVAVFRIMLPEGKYYYLNKDKSDTIPFYVDNNGFHSLK